VLLLVLNAAKVLARERKRSKSTERFDKEGGGNKECEALSSYDLFQMGTVLCRYIPCKYLMSRNSAAVSIVIFRLWHSWLS